MLARNALLFKWSVYLATMLLAVLLQATLLQHLVFAGVFPFMYPAVVAVMATYEEPIPAAWYGLIFGVLCDTVVMQSPPYLFTLTFPIIAFLSIIITKILLKSGYLSSCVVTILAYSLTGVGHCLALDAFSKTTWQLGLAITAQELAMSIFFIYPLTLLFTFIAERSRYE